MHRHALALGGFGAVAGDAVLVLQAAGRRLQVQFDGLGAAGHAEQLDLEAQRRVRRDDAAGAARAIT